MTPLATRLAVSALSLAVLTYARTIRTNTRPLLRLSPLQRVAIAQREPCAPSYN